MTVTETTEAAPQPPETIVGVARALSPLVRRILAPHPEHRLRGASANQKRASEGSA